MILKGDCRERMRQSESRMKDDAPLFAGEDDPKEDHDGRAM